MTQACSTVQRDARWNATSRILWTNVSAKTSTCQVPASRSCELKPGSARVVQRPGVNVDKINKKYFLVHYVKHRSSSLKYVTAIMSYFGGYLNHRIIMCERNACVTLNFLPWKIHPGDFSAVKKSLLSVKVRLLIKTHPLLNCCHLINRKIICWVSH